MPSSAVAGIVGRANILRECKIARKCGSVQSWALRARSAMRKSGGGSSPKLCQTFYRRRTEVLGMDLSDVGAEFGSCCRSVGAILIGILQNRQEMQFSRKDRLPSGSCSAEVGRQGHPPNFIRPSIEGEQKFGGWICPRWVPRSAVAGARRGKT
eukprot:COSAG03_NODE_4079_length_1696_cov_1.083281_3_plen_153_part_01